MRLEVPKLVKLANRNQELEREMNFPVERKSPPNRTLIARQCKESGGKNAADRILTSEECQNGFYSYPTCESKYLPKYIFLKK